MSPLSRAWYFALSPVECPILLLASSNTFSSKLSRDSSNLSRDLLFCVEMALRAYKGTRLGSARSP